jgi:hypothetical protein
MNHTIQTDINYVNRCLDRIQSFHHNHIRYLGESAILFLYLTEHTHLLQYERIRSAIYHLITHIEQVIRKERRSLHKMATYKQSQECVEANIMNEIITQLEESIAEVELELIRHS